MELAASTDSSRTFQSCRPLHRGLRLANLSGCNIVSTDEIGGRREFLCHQSLWPLRACVSETVGQNDASHFSVVSRLVAEFQVFERSLRVVIQDSRSI